MAGTRNKQMPSEFGLYQKEMGRQTEWCSPECIQSPAYPCSSVNVQKISARGLSENSTDIESFLYGIGSNNYLFPIPTPTPLLKKLPQVQFVPPDNLYLPIVTTLKNQRPFT